MGDVRPGLLQTRLDTLFIIGLIVDATCDQQWTACSLCYLDGFLHAFFRGNTSGEKQWCIIRNRGCKGDLIQIDAVVNNVVKWRPGSIGVGTVLRNGDQL